MEVRSSISLHSGCCFIFLSIAIRAMEVYSRPPPQLFIKSVAPDHRKLWLLSGSAVVFISWFIVYLAGFPGFYCYDSIHITNAVNVGLDTLSNTQSVIHTMFASSIIKIGELLFESFNAGVATYTFIQMFIMTSLVGIIISFIIDKNGSWVLVLLSIAFFALNPLLAMFASCSTKDVIFAFLLTVLGILLYKICNDKTGFTKRQFVLITVVSFLTIIYRNNAIYIVLFAILITAILLVRRKEESLKHIASLLLPYLLSIVLAFVWIGPVITALDANKSHPVNEMISIPTMQIARACYEDAEVEHELFNELGVDPGTLANQYSATPQCSDYTRPLFWDALNDGKLNVFLELWSKNVSEHPLISLEALLYLTEGAWSPFGDITGYNVGGSKYDYANTETSLFACVAEEPANLESKLPAVYAFLWSISRYKIVQSNPLTAWMVSVAFYLFVLLISFTHCSIAKNTGGTVFCTLMILLCLTNLLGPMVLVRYYLPIIYSAPLLVFFLFDRKPYGSLASKKNALRVSQQNEELLLFTP